MVTLLQRVQRARVRIDETEVASIGPGLCVFVAFEAGDDRKRLARMCERILGYRIFADRDGRMNRSLVEAGGELLLVPNFTLAADTRKGSRPSFSPAAAPKCAERLYGEFAAMLRQHHAATCCGRFGTHMRIELVNDGPVTFLLSSPVHR